MMRIEILGKEYAFEVYGTIGLMYRAEQLLGTEEFDINNKHHQVALMYAAFRVCNRHVTDLPSLEEFTCSLTTSKFSAITAHFWRRWSELEPKPSEEGGELPGEG